MVERNPEVVALLSEIRELGATVDVGPESTEAQIASAEKRLGFALPDEYRQFLLQFGGIAIELERTWFFYGLDDALLKTKEYRAEFADVAGEEDDASEDGPYYPSRFIVLNDEGDFSNAAAGTVYDDGLKAFLNTDGARYVGRDEAFQVGYWGHLLDSLSEIRDRIADPDDPLVVGSEREQERQRQIREATPKTNEQTGADAALRTAVNRLYEVFAKYPLQPIERSCVMGRCGECVKADEVLNQAPLREIKAKHLQHYAYMNLQAHVEAGLSRRQNDYKHFLPRIHEAIEGIGGYGNPAVVIPVVFANVVSLGLSNEEIAAVDAYFEALWLSLLWSPHTKPYPQLWFYLQAFAKAGRSLEPFLEVWSSLDGQPSLHAQAFVENFKFDKGPDYYGWTNISDAFAQLRAWAQRTHRAS